MISILTNKTTQIQSLTVAVLTTGLVLSVGGSAEALNYSLSGNPQADDWEFLGNSQDPQFKATGSGTADFDIYIIQFTADETLATRFGTGFQTGDRVVGVGATFAPGQTTIQSFAKFDFGNDNGWSATSDPPRISFSSFATEGDFQLQSDGEGFESIRYRNSSEAFFIQQGGVSVEDGTPFAFLTEFAEDSSTEQVAFEWFVSIDELIRSDTYQGNADYGTPTFDLVFSTGQSGSEFVDTVFTDLRATPIPFEPDATTGVLAAIGFLGVSRLAKPLIVQLSDRWKG